MKTTSLIFALFFTTAVMMGQNEKKATVRIKKVENVNGVERTTDTTYTVDGPLVLNDLEPLNGEKLKCTGKQGEKMVIITDRVTGNAKEMRVLSNDEGMDERVQNALKAAGATEDGVEKIVMMNIDDKNTDGNKTNKQVKVVIVRKMHVEDATTEDSKAISKTTGLTDGKLVTDNMKFFPNPNDGKFNLSFSLKEKGDAEVKILNMEGKVIFEEPLPAFTGTYNRDIDITKEPKGTYFVRIKQGEHAQLKKIVLE